MVQLAGKYEFVENKNFKEFLLGLGIPEEHAKAADASKDGVEVKVDGNKITLVNEGPLGVTNVVVGGEYDEKTIDGQELKSSATLEGGVLTIKSSRKDGEGSFIRTFTFTDSGYQVTIVVDKDGKTYSATRVFKRV